VNDENISRCKPETVIRDMNRKNAGSSLAYDAVMALVQCPGETKASSLPCAEAGAKAAQTALPIPRREEATNASTATEPGKSSAEMSADGVMELAGWPTASSRDVKGGYQGGRIRKGKISTDTLDVAAQLTGPPADPISAATESTGSSLRLNPAFSGWLMGFPREWALAGWIAASRSARKSKAGARS
jgi:hypothetical protein